jgi:post-segregation antitoxin (ccd killing protein)
MSQKLMLVKYELDDGVPVDDSSEVLESTFVPPELIAWAENNGSIREIHIRECAGDGADIPVTTFDPSDSRHLAKMLGHVENEIFRHAQDLSSDVSSAISTEIDRERMFETLRIWLAVQKLLRQALDDYVDDHGVRLVIG